MARQQASALSHAGLHAAPLEFIVRQHGLMIVTVRAPSCCRAPAAGSALRAAGRRRQRYAPLPAPCRASQSAEQLTVIAARLSTVRCRELLAATCVELLRAALVGSAASSPAAAAGEAEDAGNDAGGSSGQTPEELLDSLHATLSATMQDAAHQIAPEHHEAWAEGQWDAFQEAHNAVQRMLLGLHMQAAQAGCAGGSLQVGWCSSSLHGAGRAGLAAC